MQNVTKSRFDTILQLLYGIREENAYEWNTVTSENIKSQVNVSLHIWMFVKYFYTASKKPVEIKSLSGRLFFQLLITPH